MKDTAQAQRTRIEQMQALQRVQIILNDTHIPPPQIEVDAECAITLSWFLERELYQGKDMRPARLRTILAALPEMDWTVDRSGVETNTNGVRYMIYYENPKLLLRANYISEAIMS